MFFSIDNIPRDWRGKRGDFPRQDLEYLRVVVQGIEGFRDFVPDRERHQWQQAQLSADLAGLAGCQLPAVEAEHRDAVFGTFDLQTLASVLEVDAETHSASKVSAIAEEVVKLTATGKKLVEDVQLITEALQTNLAKRGEIETSLQINIDDLADLQAEVGGLTGAIEVLGGRLEGFEERLCAVEQRAPNAASGRSAANPALKAGYSELLGQKAAFASPMRPAGRRRLAANAAAAAEEVEIVIDDAHTWPHTTMALSPILLTIERTFPRLLTSRDSHMVAIKREFDTAVGNRLEHAGIVGTTEAVGNEHVANYSEKINHIMERIRVVDLAIEHGKDIADALARIEGAQVPSRARQAVLDAKDYKRPAPKGKKADKPAEKPADKPPGKGFTGGSL